MHDAVDTEAFAHLGADGPYIIMTTWHDDESFEDAMFYFKFLSSNWDIEIVDYVIVDVADLDRRHQVLAAYEACSGADA